MDRTTQPRHRRRIDPSSLLQHPGRVAPRTKQRSDREAIQVFRDNLNNLLLGAPAGPITVLGIDPGLRTGCKVAVVDETGKFLVHHVIYPHTGQTTKAIQTLARLVSEHHLKAIAIGDGTASRETDAFVRDFLADQNLADIFKVMVSESGASVYSASDAARQEFPELDLTVRSAVSIARRLQDPLSELVKASPRLRRSISFGSAMKTAVSTRVRK